MVSHTFEFSILAFFAMMRHGVSLCVVSSGTLSANTTSRSASFNSTSSRFTSPTLGSSFPFSKMSEFFTLSFPTRPFTRAALMKSPVFSFASSSVSSSTTTCFFSSGFSLTSATMLPTCASVSVGAPLTLSRCTTLTSFISKSSGKRSRTLPTCTSIPVFSDAYAEACFTAQRWKGGK